MNLYEKRKSQGLCGLCGKERDGESQAICCSCKNKQNNVYKKRKSRGKCFACDQPSIKKGGSYCKKHYEMRMAKRDKRREQGLCYECGKNPSTNQGKRCVNCSLSGVAQRLNGVTLKQIIGKLESQNYKCPISGRSLTVGLNCHLDHIIPKSRGGNDSINNIRWVDKDVNQAKHGLLDDEFFSLIKEISNHI